MPRTDLQLWCAENVISGTYPGFQIWGPLEKFGGPLQSFGGLAINQCSTRIINIQSGPDLCTG